MDIQIKVPEEFKDMIVSTIFELVKEHRYHCDGSCSITLMPLRLVIEQLIGRPLEHEEFKILT